jgi:uncharacterized short protein YbdD (DUF466 family)
MADACERRPARTSAVRAGAAGALRGWRAVAWYVRDLMGDNAYRVYLEHHHRHHGPDHPPLTEREFWRQRMDEQDRNPGARCC